ncbi:class I SAM-dependent methyltransferase [Phyllobacterium sp. CCNWLW109]|uniref:class I SAM-dependent methyltransferase n=1 Tax=Phyllobacterium sp. CCNWLW109 TaxID=3127479 RepID=UPI0030788193
MAYSDFLEAYAKLKSVSVTELEEMAKTQSAIKYVLSNRTRGAEYIERIKKLYTKPLKGASVIDIGCAYGGICIELAKAGAKTVGIDVITSYINLARSNASGEVSSEFFLGDFTNKKTLQMFAGRKFDVFIVNHVLEHIYDTVSLLENISALASDDAIIVFDFPNGQSIQSVRAEGHTGYFAASLVAPDCWYMFNPHNRARIYYRKWKYFTSLFEDFGFGTVIRAMPTPPKDRRAALLAFIEEIDEKRLTVKDDIKPITNEVILQHIEEIRFDLENADDKELDSKHFSYFWKGAAAKRKDLIPEKALIRLEESDWGN